MSTMHLPPYARIVALRDKNHTGYDPEEVGPERGLSEPTWVIEDDFGCWVETCDPQPKDDRIGSVAEALGVGIESLYPIGYVGGGVYAFVRATEYEIGI